MRLAVLGNPVAHSLSPALHGAALRSVGLEGTYVAHRVDAGGMVQALDEIRSGALDGANVTMPHKQLAADLVDRGSTVAMRARAVNTITRVGEEAIGHNTDVAGVRYAAQTCGLPDAPVLILGAGGAAAAAALAYESGPITFSARRTEAARNLVSSLQIDAAVVAWGTPVPRSLLINATALGMHGEQLPFDDLTVFAGLLDMPYASGPTPAAATMRAARLPVAEGPDMLLGQAIASFRLWTGRIPDEHAMRSAMQAAALGL